jgi:hypothetical protein
MTPESSGSNLLEKHNDLFVSLNRVSCAINQISTFLLLTIFIYNLILLNYVKLITSNITVISSEVKHTMNHHQIFNFNKNVRYISRHARIKLIFVYYWKNFIP